MQARYRSGAAGAQAAPTEPRHKEDSCAGEEVVQARATARPSRPLSCFLHPPALGPWPWQWGSGRLGAGQPASSSASALLVGRLTLSWPSTLPESIISKAALAITGVNLRGGRGRPGRHAQERTTRETAAGDQKNWSSIELMFLWGEGEVMLE